MNAEFAPLFELSCAERLQLVEDLWESIAKEADQIPVPDWQIEEVERIRIKAGSLEIITGNCFLKRLQSLRQLVITIIFTINVIVRKHLLKINGKPVG